jgi:hypothetical protein
MIDRKPRSTAAVSHGRVDAAKPFISNPEDVPPMTGTSTAEAFQSALVAAPSAEG